jgi:pimeloyl-ACP methyl ester carboxylesterase
MKSQWFRTGLLSCIVACSIATTYGRQTAINTYDPVTMDPPEGDTTNPPQLAEISIGNSGERINALFYIAAGRGPSPTVILLHGIPGNERNLDVAQAVRRAGANVLFLSYRGTWGNGGLFSRANALADVATALRYLRSAESVGRYHIDVRRLALVGHSFGGWVALMGAAADPTVACVAGIDVANVGARAKLLRSDPARSATAIANAESLIAPGAPYRATSGAALVAEMKAHADEWDLPSHASELRSRPVLLISAVNGDEQRDLVAALRNAKSPVLTDLNWITDHSFSNQRIQLARTIVQWLQSSCGF